MINKFIESIKNGSRPAFTGELLTDNNIVDILMALIDRKGDVKLVDLDYLIYVVLVRRSKQNNYECM